MAVWRGNCDIGQIDSDGREVILDERVAAPSMHMKVDPRSGSHPFRLLVHSIALGSRPRC